MVNIHMVKIVKGLLLFILYLAHPFNLIQVSFLSFISFIVSTNLKQQIASHLGKDEDVLSPRIHYLPINRRIHYLPIDPTMAHA